MALALLGLLIGYGHAWLAGFGLGWVLMVAWRLEHDQACGELSIVPEGSIGCRWNWRPKPGNERLDATLRCHYLGPWLIALEIDGRRLWLWPDSSSRESLRELRRWLVQFG